MGEEDAAARRTTAMLAADTREAWDAFVRLASGAGSRKANRFIGLEPMLLKDELKRVSAIQRI